MRVGTALPVASHAATGVPGAILVADAAGPLEAVIRALSARVRHTLMTGEREHAATAAVEARRLAAAPPRDRALAHQLVAVATFAFVAAVRGIVA